MTRLYDTLPSGTKLTKAQAIKKYPKPHFVDRPTGRESYEEIEAALQQRIDAIQGILDNLKRLARRQYCGSRLRKKDLIYNINMLHDWHRQCGGYYSMAEPGQPILWED